MRNGNGEHSGRGLRTAGIQVILALLVLLLGLSATGWMAATQYRQQRTRTEERFQQAAEKYFERTLREIQLFMEVLDSICQLHSLSDQVTPEAFEEVVRKGMIYQRRILGAYGFAQHIPGAMREAFETQVLRHPIVRYAGGGRYEPTGEQTLYYPLSYQTPPGGLGLPIGYDFMAREEDRTAIEAMQRWGVFGLGGLATPDDSTASRDRYMFAPILYRTATGERELTSFAIGLFQPDQILAAAMGSDSGGLQAGLQPAVPDNLSSNAPGHFERVFSLANQEWMFFARVDGSFRAQRESSVALRVLVRGGLLSFLLAGALLLQAGRARRIEALVKKRTAELAEANLQLKGLMTERRELEEKMLRTVGGEKARIGRDLHDSLGQKLTGAMYLFGAYRQKVPDSPEEANQIATALKEAVSQVRRIARGLAPVALTEDGLPDALRRLAEESAALFKQSIEFYAEREGRPRDVESAEHLYLIAQEAVNNAINHGRAQRVVLTLDYDGANGCLTIEDNGIGLQAGSSPAGEGGSGLRIMRHRAELIGGSLELSSPGGGGVRICCRFPALPG
jgi:signal transduction histidine kinase